MITIADFLQMDSFRRAGMKHGGEYHGPDCPFCGSGTNRFVVWPEERGIGTYWCRSCEESGDAIDLLRKRDGLSFPEACARLGRPTGTSGAPYHREGRAPSRWQKGSPRADRPSAPPSRSGPAWPPSSDEGLEDDLPPAPWRDQARGMLPKAIERLWSVEGKEARAYLLGRGLGPEVVREACLGFISSDTYLRPAAWGLDDGPKILLPRGIVIPTAVGYNVTSLKVRRLSPTAERPKYHYVRGGRNRLHGLNALHSGRPLVIVEGEFDRLALRQEVGDRVNIVATGSASGGRRDAVHLGFPPVVLLAFDDDKAGDGAAQWWRQYFGSRRVGTRRVRPEGHDVNAMLLSGLDLRSWIDAAILGSDTDG